MFYTYIIAAKDRRDREETHGAYYYVVHCQKRPVSKILNVCMRQKGHEAKLKALQSQKR